MKLGIIAGIGYLPIYIAKQNKDAFVLCIEEHSYSKSFDNQTSSVSLLNPDDWIKILNNYNITHLIMAGKINRPKVINKNLNKKGIKLITKINSLGDNSALNLIEIFFNKNGFQILPINSILKDCFLPKGFYPKKISPSFQKYITKSAEVGVNLLNTLSKFDVGQSTVVSNNLVYAIEGLEGTDAMIDRVGGLYENDVKLKKEGPVLIKIPKKNQNINLDLPVIGLNTIENCIKYGFSSIVISSEGTLIIDLKSIISFLNNNDFYIYSI